jgi:hypothetical protein
LEDRKRGVENALTPKNDNSLCTWVPKLTAAYHIHRVEASCLMVLGSSYHSI